MVDEFINEIETRQTAESRAKNEVFLDQTYEIPENTWAVFPCKRPLPLALQSVNQKIYREWLPQNPDYEVAGKYNIEMYTDASNYPKGTADENYYSEIWIPIKAK